MREKKTMRLATEVEDCIPWSWSMYRFYMKTTSEKKTHIRLQSYNNHITLLQPMFDYSQSLPHFFSTCMFFFVYWICVYAVGILNSVLKTMKEHPLCREQQNRLFLSVQSRLISVNSCGNLFFGCALNSIQFDCMIVAIEILSSFWLLNCCRFFLSLCPFFSASAPLCVSFCLSFCVSIN